MVGSLSSPVSHWSDFILQLGNHHYPPPTPEMEQDAMTPPIPTMSFPFLLSVKKLQPGASLVAQWLRICLPVQGTRVRALVWEDPTCCRAARSVSHKY